MDRWMVVVEEQASWSQRSNAATCLSLPRVSLPTVTNVNITCAVPGCPLLASAWIYSTSPGLRPCLRGHRPRRSSSRAAFSPRANRPSGLTSLPRSRSVSWAFGELPPPLLPFLNPHTLSDAETECSAGRRRRLSLKPCRRHSDPPGRTSQSSRTRTGSPSSIGSLRFSPSKI